MKHYRRSKIGRIALTVVLGLCAGAATTASPCFAAGRGDITIDDTYVFPESMTSTADGAVIFGSAKGIIYRAKPGETLAKPWITLKADKGQMNLLGVLADDKSDTLWVCTMVNAFSREPSDTPATVMTFKLSDGTKTGSYPFPPPASVCNDISIAKDGTAYVSDTGNGRIFTLKPGAKALTLFADDARLKGIDGLVFGGDGTLYVNIVSRGALMRVDIKPDGTVGDLTELKLSQPVGGPDGFRLISGNRFLLAEGTAGKLDEVTIKGDDATIKVLKDGLNSSPGTTLVGKTAYIVEGKIGYLFDPKLKGKDPGPFKAYAVPLGDME